MALNILAFETSCDETSAAILLDNEVLSNIISLQTFHNEYGGIVPELASRAQLEVIDKVTRKAIADSRIESGEIGLVAAASGPGLIGSLLTGLNYAKAFAIGRNIRFIAVNHIEAHMYSCFIGKRTIDFPFLSLVVSGGHTILSLVAGYFEHRILGQTQDDAAGEAFDKAAKMLGLGYPGGPLIDCAAKNGDENFHEFPVSNVRENSYDFSFSGIKTSLLYYLRKKYKADKIPLMPEEMKNKNIPINDICASFQKAVVESLTEKAIAAAEELNVRRIAVSGGVSANSKLRTEFLKLTGDEYEVYFPSLEYTTDNAAMIGYCAYLKNKYGKMTDEELERQISEPAFARLEPPHAN